MAAEYLAKHGVEGAIKDALTQILRSQPDDPLTALGETLCKVSANHWGRNSWKRLLAPRR